ncbi:hypothetical protein F5879DRAFT_698000 [Lentinula edodes]|uniref:Uncharacterized protein n=1 Tax=Lentinula edodes TaxID=5353 RepID=A0A1Q3DV97_LENED|nr:uncharacterized protein C8R40DRAFT_1042868 [Lentinula edodes]KAF8826847.1 hypothetical protein HHX47_DHR5001113 [Lentinula edodes]KAH7876296.1 hypothetical protein C8R40DRAFT_1042868 [Lentinula edodes]KAJ3909849.1 hypothetical protein F5879DRAFT_698000 [Lentinula edodes]KAJ3924125.1 hypothetical protein F5877DRAFT_30259 [Lentinula edodes]GAV98924.1 hypothetical protein LENED_000346 [Lentinula edodes]
MSFRPRNPYYLRISKKDVLAIYLYLDDRHVDWMNDIILQHVLEDLRPKIIPKLQAEVDLTSGTGGLPSTKKATVETHRGETYQFCYFFRKTQPHTVVLKTRTYTAAPPQKQNMMLPPTIPAKAMKRKSKTGGVSQILRKKQKTKGKSRAIDDSESEEPLSEEYAEVNNTSGATPGIRLRQTAALDLDGDSHMREGDDENDDDDDNDDDDYIPKPRKNEKARAKTIHFSLEIEDDEEEKPKPLLHLKYQGFKILGSCLCIVVEPWPPLHASSRAPSILRSTPRAPSIAPRDFVTANEARARSKTPLFLPDPDERDRSATPFPDAIHVRPFPLYDNEGVDEDMDDADYGGMMEFSQILNAAGDVRAGALDDDEDMEGAVFFGDADEIREL